MIVEQDLKEGGGYTCASGRSVLSEGPECEDLKEASVVEAVARREERKSAK